MTAFIPRYDDCEPGGRLHPAGYLRAMLQAAIEAGAAKDHGAPKEPGAPKELGAPEEDAAAWLERVGDLGVRIDRPVMFGDAVEIETRLATQGPPVWRREFVFKRAGATLATGFVDCFDDANADGDGDDDDDEQQAREPDFDLNSEPAREEQPAWDGPVPEPPAAPGRAFKGVWHVAWQHLDISGQVDPAVLTTMVGDMESRATESLGWTPRREYENGLIWQVSEHRLELFDTIEDEDALHIVSYIGEVDKDEMVRHTSIWRAESGVLNEVARARTRRVCTAPETGERRSIDDDWLYDLDDQLAEW